MSNTSAEEQQIKTLIREYLDGDKKDFQKISLILFDYAYILTKPVFIDEDISRHIAEHILKRLEQNLDKVNLDRDFYAWFSIFCGYRMYRIICNHESTLYRRNRSNDSFRYKSIKEDELLAEAANHYFDEVVRNDTYIELTTPQRLLLEMYAVLELDTDRIAHIFKTDKFCIENELAFIRKKLVKENEHTNEVQEESGLIDLLFPGLSKSARLRIDIIASCSLMAVFIICNIL